MTHGKKFDFDQALDQLRSGQNLTGQDGVLTPLIKQLTEAALSAELDEHLKDAEQPNRKNGKTSKTVKSVAGAFELDTPRDRAGSFEPVHFPKTEVQQCIIHQIRNSGRYIASKHQKEFMRDLKPVYRAANKSAAETALDELDTKWGKQYPLVIDSWRRKWEHLSAYFQYPEYIRRVMYTTNAVEAVHRQFRKLTKTKGGFPNEHSLLKLLYAGILNASKKWTKPIPNWNLALSQLAIHFEGRLDHVLDL